MDKASSNQDKMMERLIQAAKEGNWEYVDGQMPGLAKSETAASWAYNGLLDNNESVRDLAASILESTQVPFSDFKDVRQRLNSLMPNYPPGYDGFRAACALACHNPGEYAENIRSTLQMATRDEDENVRIIAKKYLAELNP